MVDQAPLPQINIITDVSAFNGLNQETFIWSISILMVVTAMLYRCLKCVKYQLCLSDEGYVREYFEELELSERLDLTPVMVSDKTSIRPASALMTSSYLHAPLSSHQSSSNIYPHQNQLV